jgi:predicted RNA-binding Zn ribbon-like protein
MATADSDAARERRFAFNFGAGRLCLDFANTGGIVSHTPAEDLATSEDMARWFGESALALPNLRVPAHAMATIRMVRDASWRVAHAFAHGQPYERTDIEIINRAARTPPLVPQLEAESGGRRWHDSADVAAAVSTIARDAVELFASPDAHRIRECANPRCILFFVDRSRPGRRRWCSMRRCGNLAKTRHYRSHRADKATR